MAGVVSKRGLAIGLGATLVAIVFGVWLGARKDREPGPSAPFPPEAVVREDASGSSGLQRPLAAAHGADGEVFVAALDAAARQIRLQRYDANGALVQERGVLDDVAWSSDADLSLSADPAHGVALTWRGLRGGKLVRQLVVAGLDLAPRGAPIDVNASSCTTADAVWYIEGTHVVSRPWDGAPSKVPLAPSFEPSLMCGRDLAYALLVGEEETAILPLAGADAGRAPVVMLTLRDLGGDERRDLFSYMGPGELGLVRFASSGALSVRELSGSTPGPLRRLTTTIPKDDDVVAVDASERVIVIVYTEDASSTCAPEGEGASTVATRVKALRVDRRSFEESIVELSPGRCGDDVGPFFTGVVGDEVSVAWPERRGGIGLARAPIVGLAHALVGVAGEPRVGRIEQAATELVDAGCDATGCRAAALAPAVDGGGPEVVSILRYARR